MESSIGLVRPSFLKWRSICLFLAVFTLSACGDKYKQEAVLEQTSIDLARQADESGYALISTGELAEMIDSKEPFLLVDVRTAQDYAKGHIPGAVNFTFPKGIVMSDRWDPSLMEGLKEEDFIRLLGDNEGRVLVFTCGRTRCERGHNAAMWAVRLGYHNVFRHPGGVEAWQGKGLKLETSK
ncbi:rhodanese-like domain-containing protein [Endozoicomonas arenosclerae]|uniref:rhodanese-like domain-containing protein n=1 Tax=Endozoicomonas arenosclerae TaxID=1633495 RepID=UPI0007803D7B|nr:rhodanese-like domain-containing protein [Endozoicomonas arenosclerae]